METTEGNREAEVLREEERGWFLSNISDSSGAVPRTHNLPALHSPSQSPSMPLKIDARHIPNNANKLAILEIQPSTHNASVFFSPLFSSLPMDHRSLSLPSFDSHLPIITIFFAPLSSPVELLNTHISGTSLCPRQTGDSRRSRDEVGDATSAF